MIEAFHLPTEAGVSPWTVALFLFLLPFAREDVAIVAGSYLIVEQRVPAELAVGSLYAGIIASDILIFAIGRLARRSPWISARVGGVRGERIGQWLKHHLLAAMIVARLVPGTIFPVYAACGLTGVGLLTFLPITMATAAIYLPALLWLVTRFGENVLSTLGLWAWVLALVLLLTTLLWVRRPPLGLLLRVGRSGLAGLRVPRGKEAYERVTSHIGMPALRGLKARIGRAERIPPSLFYVPLGAQWLWLALRHRSLSLPTIANPMIEVGGLWGESKRAYLDMVSGEARRWLAPYVTLVRGALDDTARDTAKAVGLARGAGLDFPLVAKPDIGWQGYGVRLVHSEPELAAYMAAFPEGATLMLQALVPWEGEAGVFYVRHPNEESGTIAALTLRYFPHVTGDGTRSLRDLILDDQRASWKAGAHLGLDRLHGGLPPAALERVPAAGEVVRLSFIGSIRVGGLYRDASALVTPALSARFDEISRAMPEFHYGRYDIRFASVERLQSGEDFRIIEINGAGSEAISAWDPERTVAEVYGRLLRQQRLLFEIGAENRRRGYRPAGLPAVLRAAWKQSRLVSRYPPSS